MGTLGLWVLELFAVFAMNGQTDRQTDGRTKAKLTVPIPMGGCIISNGLKRRLAAIFAYLLLAVDGKPRRDVFQHDVCNVVDGTTHLPDVAVD